MKSGSAAEERLEKQLGRTTSSTHHPNSSPFIINLFLSWKIGKKVENDNPWGATTLEWSTPTPPGHGNFTYDVAVYRGPYEYSRPDCDKDYFPQWEAPKKKTEEQANKPAVTSTEEQH